MSPETCMTELKGLINEKVVASCWLFTLLYVCIIWQYLKKKNCSPLKECKMNVDDGYLHPCTKMMHGHTNIKYICNEPELETTFLC